MASFRPMKINLKIKMIDDYTFMFRGERWGFTDITTRESHDDLKRMIFECVCLPDSQPRSIVSRIEEPWKL